MTHPASSANKRTRTDVWGRLLKVRSSLVIVVVALCASVLAPVTVSAHDSTTETYEVEVPVYEWVTEPIMATREVPVYDWVATEFEVERTREVPVYDWVPTEVEVERTRQVPVYDWVPTEVEVERTREVPVYDWVPTLVEVQRTRVVPVYNEATYTVRVAPFRERVTFQPPCEWTTVYGQRVYYCPPPRTRWQDVYNYQTATRYVLVGTRTETYTSTETQLVWTQTGTRTETYTSTEIRNVRTQTGTRTHTYTSTETQLVLTQTGTSTETYTATEIRNVRTQTGTRTHTYDTGATRIVKRATGRTETETRTRPVHGGCPDGYYELDSPDTQAWHTSGGGITFERSLLFGGEVVTWLGPLAGHPDCYAPDQSGIGWGDIIAGTTEIIVGGVEYVVSGGEVVIDGVTYVVEAGRIVINNAAGIVGTAFETALAQAIQQHLSTFTKAALRDLCTNALTAGTTAALITVALGAAPITFGTTVVAAGVIAALTTLACIQLRDWYDPPPVEPGPVSGLSLAVSDGVIEVSWNAPAETDTRGFGYDINWKRASEAWGGASSEVRKIPGSTTSYRISGLVNDEAYTVQVTARNDGGESAALTGTATPTSTTSTTTTTPTTVPPTTTTTAVSPSSLPVVTVVPDYDRANYRLRYFQFIEAVPSSCTPWVDWQVQTSLTLVVALCPR